MKANKTKKVSQLKVNTQLRAGFNLEQLKGQLQRFSFDIGSITQSTRSDVTIMGGEDVV